MKHMVRDDLNAVVLLPDMHDQSLRTLSTKYSQSTRLVSAPDVSVKRNRAHICIVTETYPPEINGVAHTLRHLVAGLTRRGFAVSLVRPFQRSIDSDIHTSGLDEMRPTLVGGLPLPGYRGLQFGLPSSRTLRRRWINQRPDAIYIATQGPLGWSAARVARSLGITAYSGFHTNYDYYSRHYRVGYFQRFILRYLRTFHNGTCGTLVPAINLQNRLEALGFNNVTVLGRGVDSRLFCPERRDYRLRRDWGVDDDQPALIYVGRLAPEKNLEVAIAAYRVAKSKNARLKLILVGDGPLRPVLQQAHRDLVFCGLMTGEDLARYYASGDIFLFPSETETFGNVTLEAMASGLGVLAYDYAAAHMHIKHSETGVLVPFGDADAFKSATLELLQKPLRLIRIRHQARQYALGLQWESIVCRFAQILLRGDRSDLHTPHYAEASGFER